MSSLHTKLIVNKKLCINKFREKAMMNRRSFERNFKIILYLKKKEETLNQLITIRRKKNSLKLWQIGLTQYNNI